MVAASLPPQSPTSRVPLWQPLTKNMQEVGDVCDVSHLAKVTLYNGHLLSSCCHDISLNHNK